MVASRIRIAALALAGVVASGCAGSAGHDEIGAGSQAGETAPGASASAPAPSSSGAPSALVSAAPVASDAPPEPSTTSGFGVDVLAPYPRALADKALVANADASCQELVYKRGCSELRTGAVELAVNLGPDGRVVSVEVLKNGIGRDPEVVAKCLKKKVQTWTFEAPAGFAPRALVTVVLSDKC